MGLPSSPNPSTDFLATEMSFVFPCFALQLSPTLNKIRVRRFPRSYCDAIPTDFFVLGPHDFSWAVLPHVGHFLESDVPIAAYLYNSPLHGRSRSPRPFFELEGLTCPQTVRSAPDDVKFQDGPAHRPAFLVVGAHNVILETIKRGDDDDVSGHGPKTVVLRLYEAYGGHATVRLLISSSLDVEKAMITNLLEDDNGDELGFTAAVEAEATGGYSHYIKLSFRRFEVKTVKLTLGSGIKK